MLIMLLFVGGTIVMPGIHKMGLDSRDTCSCAHVENHHSETEDDKRNSAPDEESNHNPDTCPVCVLASKAYVATCFNVRPVNNPVTITNLAVFIDSYVSTHFCVSFLARAPPVSA